jgi:predicted amidohydrolase
MKLRIATAQFPVSRDLDRNLGYVRRQIASAAKRRADLVLFPEAALGGYAGENFRSFAGYDWKHLARATESAAAEAARHAIWIVVGTNHFSGGRGKPRNSLLVIDPEGRIVKRYDKRFCTTGDLKHYQAGNRAATFRIRGQRCGLLICHEWRYPELYRQYKKLKADVILQSWYDGGLSAARWDAEGKTYLEVIPATVQGHAACNHFWICGTNTSQKLSCFGGFSIRPDGTFQQRHSRHRAGVTVHEIDTARRFDDPAAHGRARAMRGVK